MKYIVSISFCLFFGFVNAQIPLRHHVKAPNGPVLKVETKTFAKVTLNENGEPDFSEGPISKSVMEFENKLPKAAHIYANYLEDKELLMMKLIYEHDTDGNLKSVKTYDVDHWKESAPIRLNKTCSARYRNGKIVSENIIENGGKLLSTFEYWEVLDKEKKPIQMMQHLNIIEGEMEEGQIYGVQYIDGIKTLHFSLKGTDTTYLKRITKIKEQDVISVGFQSNGKIKRPFIAHSEVKKRDRYNNPTIQVAWAEKEGETSPRSYSITRYLYEGEDSWEPVVDRPFLTTIQGEWISLRKNIKLTIGGQINEFPGGIYSSSEIEKLKEDRIMDSGDSWIQNLAESSVGEWKWDEENSQLAFEQKGHIISKIKAKIENDILILSPDKEWENELRLKRK